MASKRHLPFGSDDLPGCSHLPKISPLLWVGNMRSAAMGEYDVVISTCKPVDAYGCSASSFTTVSLMFEDGRGRESGEEVHVARKLISKGASIVKEAIAADKRVLVHCAWGQNRSCSICCAYAVVYLGWSANDAIDYVRECNRRDRCYRGQEGPNCGAMHNSVFCDLISEMQRARDAPAGAGAGAAVAT